MTLRNITRGTVIVENVSVAKTLLEEANGLLDKDEFSSVFLKTRWGIHTFGMKFPIDCVIADEELRVVSLRENLSPCRFFFWPPRHKNVLELPAGAISKSGTEKGDKLEMNG
jgi:uncharacterized membrane protein (UPF0127 family)